MEGSCHGRIAMKRHTAAIRLGSGRTRRVLDDRMGSAAGTARTLPSRSDVRVVSLEPFTTTPDAAGGKCDR
jgi:hypothetical protein